MRRNEHERRGRGWALSALLLSLSGGVAGAAGVSRALADEAPASFRVVAHPQSTAARADRQFIADAFLKKATRWPDGEAIRAVDQPVDAPTRQEFSERVLRRSVSAIRNYWQQRIFTGRGVPPPELESDEAVLAYVRKHRGAVGYVSAGAETSTVKVLELR